MPLFSQKIHGQGKDHATTGLQSIEPDIGRTRSTGVDVNHIGGVERHCRAIAVDHLDIGKAGEVVVRAGRQFGFEFNPCNPAVAPRQMTDHRRVVSGSGADVHGTFAVLQSPDGNKERQK
jgi:hypothetical protein